MVATGLVEKAGHAFLQRSFTFALIVLGQPLPQADLDVFGQHLHGPLAILFRHGPEHIAMITVDLFDLGQRMPVAAHSKKIRINRRVSLTTFNIRGFAARPHQQGVERQVASHQPVHLLGI